MRRVKFAVATVLVMAGSACVKEEIVPAGANVGPSLVVEQFLRATNAKDLNRMSQLFGTKDGPIAKRDQKQQVEQRMFAIASILRHDDFEVMAEQIVPGRTGEATLLTVKVTIDQRNYTVPFTMVRYKSDSWLVEKIGIEVITAPRS